MTCFVYDLVDDRAGGCPDEVPVQACEVMLQREVVVVVDVVVALPAGTELEFVVHIYFEAEMAVDGHTPVVERRVGWFVGYECNCSVPTVWLCRNDALSCRCP